MKYTRNGAVTEVPFFHQEYVVEGRVGAIVVINNEGDAPLILGEKSLVPKKYGGEGAGVPTQCWDEAWKSVGEELSRTPSTSNGVLSDVQQAAFVQRVFARAGEICARAGEIGS